MAKARKVAQSKGTFGQLLLQQYQEENAMDLDGEPEGESLGSVDSWSEDP